VGGHFDRRSQSVSSASGAAFGAVRRNLISPFAGGPCLPRFLKKSAAVSTHSNFFGDRYRDPLFKDTPSSFASRWAAS